jgi:basic membrane protein A and related proteins
MSTQPWTKLARVTLAGALLASAIGVSGAPLVAAQEDTDCSAISGGVQLPETVDGKFNVGMVLIGPHNDGGWSQAHFEGLQYLCENMDNVHVAYMENVPEGADSEQVFRSLARKGFDFIIGTSFGYMDPMELVAEDFPDSTFLHLTGYKSNGENFGNFFGAMEDFKYLAGMLAGSRAKLDGNPKIGYMATFPIPEELRLGNAIMLGVKETCPECTMDVRFINTWHDPTLERDGAASLFDAGAQVVFTGADTPAVAQVAEEKGKWGVTYDHPGSCALDACLTAPYWIWGPEYLRIAEQVAAGEYTAGYEYFDADAGAMGLYGFMEGETPQPGIADLPEEDVQMVRDTLAAMLAGEFTRFDVFAGPIMDNEGNQILAAGESLVQADLDQFPNEDGSNCPTCMYWWADGIEAALP